ncbi:MAG TPA: hypothetical protein VHF24_13585 [Acidimicrobiales bacterium]|nr:hypothetical protein [Acidimicrobiales bacterium]
MHGGQGQDQVGGGGGGSRPSLTGTMAIVALDATGEERTAAIARALAAEGATVILVTGGGDRGGRLASVLHEEAQGRVAVFCAGSDPAADLEALTELAAELSPRS